MAKAATAKKATAETPEQSADRPLLDLNNDAVKKMIRAAKKRGYVTVDELNAVMPSEEVSPDQIEDTMSMLSEMGINVVEEEETEDGQQTREAEAGRAEDCEADRVAPHQCDHGHRRECENLGARNMVCKVARVESEKGSGPHHAEQEDRLDEKPLGLLSRGLLRQFVHSSAILGWQASPPMRRSRPGRTRGYQMSPGHAAVS